MLALLTILVFFIGTPAWAHKPSDSYLSLDIQGAEVSGQWDIALRDLDYALGLDRDNDGAITWGEVRSRHDDITAYALAHLKLEAGGTVCSTAARDQLIDHHSDGAYTVLRLTASCPITGNILSIDYRLFFDLDAQHKGLLRLTQHGETTAAIFSQSSPSQTFSPKDASLWRESKQYLYEGVWHIWLGYDHLLFLLTLLLPAVLVRRERLWEPVRDFPSALREVVVVVTAFTIAHSLTLGLATLGFVQLPSRLVESAIAGSVILAGTTNLYPSLIQRRSIVAFLFGLIHGFGFAGVLSGLGLPQSSLLLGLGSFNLGVEIGQLAVVACFLPLAFTLRNSPVYQPGILRAGSIAVMLIALVWLAERALNITVLFPQ